MLAVFRIEKNKNYTVMSNHHLRNMEISLKAKGLLSQMLSLPPEWDYTLAGLSKINKEGIDAIREAVKELERAGYITRKRLRDSDGKYSRNEYVIREIPSLENPTLEDSTLENPMEIKKEEQITDIENKEIDYHPFISYQEQEAIEAERLIQERENYRSLIMENIGYEYLAQEMGYKLRDLDEIVELILDTVCSTKHLIRIGGEEMPKEVVKSRLLKLDSEHIRYVMDCMRENTTKVKNIKQYLLTTLYNAPITINNYYSALVNHDMYGGGI